MSILEPRQNWSIIPASQIAGLLEQRVLIVGQMLTTGTATEKELIQDHPNDGSENTLFGRSSHIAGLVRDFKKINGATQLDLLPLVDSTAAVKATGVTAFSGTATENGTLYVSVASEKNYTVKVDVLIDDTPTDIGDSVESKLNALLNAPFSSLNNVGTVTYTAENGGTLANDWCLKVTGKVAGITTTITSWANGTDDPDITSILDVIANIRYRTVIWPSVYSLTDVEEYLLNLVLSGH
jgi:phage tail sheath gpL-like